MTYSIQKNSFVLAAKKALIWQKIVTKSDLNSSSASARSSVERKTSQLYKKSARWLLLVGLGAVSTVSHSEMILDPADAGGGRAHGELSFRCTHDATSDQSLLWMRWSSNQVLGATHVIRSVNDVVGSAVATVLVHSDVDGDGEYSRISVPVKDYNVVAQPQGSAFSASSEVILNLNLEGVLPPLYASSEVQVFFDNPNITFAADAIDDDKAIYHAVGRNMKMLQNSCAERDEGGAQDRIVFKQVPEAAPQVSNFSNNDGLLSLYGVDVNGVLYDVFLTQASFSRFVLRNFVIHTGATPASIAIYNTSTLILDIPKVSAFGDDFKATLKNTGNFEFELTSSSVL